MLYDHILMFNTEDEAKTLFEHNIYNLLSRDSWNESIVIPNQKVILARATYSTDTEFPVELTPEITVPGFFMTISLDHESQYLRELPNNACRLIGNRESGGILYLAPDISVEFLTKAIIEPVPAGSNYLMGNL